ncbi:MAG: SpoIIIAH-like family protein [Clostridia bacterium]|nr:SpoIIIAH-like family protein [Clostridia bacterium]
MKMLKKNQIIIYVIALMLVVAGYLNFTTSDDLKSAVQTSSTEEELAKMANIGDAQLVSSNVVPEEEVIEGKVENTLTNNIANNTTNNVKEEETVYTNNEAIKDNKDNDEYFSKSKLERDKMYSQMLETYEKVLSSNNSLETQKQSASEEIKKINNTKNSIMICENLILIKGFENCIIFVNGNSISVIVEDNELNVEEVAQIQNIISREMNAQIENIHIQSK